MTELIDSINLPLPALYPSLTDCVYSESSFWDAVRKFWSTWIPIPRSLALNIALKSALSSTRSILHGLRLLHSQLCRTNSGHVLQEHWLLWGRMLQQWHLVGSYLSQSWGSDLPARPSIILDLDLALIEKLVLSVTTRRVETCHKNVGCCEEGCCIDDTWWVIVVQKSFN